MISGCCCLAWSPIASGLRRRSASAYRDWDYWGQKPVPGFKRSRRAGAGHLGLAPGAHGSNRTGRPFTGSCSGSFLYRVLYEVGFAKLTAHRDRSQRRSYYQQSLHHRGRALCACDNKPTPQELAPCAPFLDREIAGLKNLKVVVALGKDRLRRLSELLEAPGRAHQQERLSLQTWRQLRYARRQSPAGLVSSFKPEHANRKAHTENVSGRFFRKPQRLASE